MYKVQRDQDELRLETNIVGTIGGKISSCLIVER